MEPIICTSRSEMFTLQVMLSRAIRCRDRRAAAAAAAADADVRPMSSCVML